MPYPMAPLKERKLASGEKSVVRPGDNKIDAIWKRHKGQGESVKRRCEFCRANGYAKFCYPAIYSGKCVRCGSDLTEPIAPC